VSILSRTEKACQIAVQGETQEFAIAGVRNFTQRSKISGIVLTHESGEGTLYLKGELRSVRKLIDASVRDEVISITKEFESNGLRGIILCQRKLSKAEVQEFR
jgi:hypothetical protein